MYGYMDLKQSKRMQALRSNTYVIIAIVLHRVLKSLSGTKAQENERN
jgi:hypothetical protein